MLSPTRFAAVSGAASLWRLTRLFGLIATVASAAGCRQPTEVMNSTNVRTTGIYAEFQISSDGSTGLSIGTATAKLRSGTSKSNTFLVLGGDDRLLVQVGGESYVMEDRGDDNGEKYGVDFPVPATESEVRIVFERGPNDIVARDSGVLLPADFRVLPLPRVSYSRRSDPLEARWVPFDPSKSVDLRVMGPCLALSDTSQVDSGMATVPPQAIRPAKNVEPERRDTCTASFGVVKKRVGRVDPIFASGTFSAAMERRNTFVTSP